MAAKKISKKKSKTVKKATGKCVDRKVAMKLYAGLVKLYPEVECALTHKNAFELLVATILSAQCTDERVNKVTPEFFKHYPTAKKMAKAEVGHIEELIHSTGFYRNKAKSISGMANRVMGVYGGEIPDTMEDLLTLPGVARKTANVLLGTWFKKNVGVVVDTHVKRLSNRMGLTKESDPKKIEQDLMKLFPQEEWTALSHRMIWHGRSLCSARKTHCEECLLKKDCPQIGV